MALAWWLRRLLSPGRLAIVVVEPLPTMTFRPALVTVFDRDPLAVVAGARVARDRLFRRLGVEERRDRVVHVDPQRRVVETAAGGPLSYDVLFLAPGHHDDWDRWPGLAPARLAVGGAAALTGVCEPHLARHAGTIRQQVTAGHVLFVVGPLLHPPAWDPPMPVACECPAVESALLWEAWLRRTGRRSRVRLTLLTPASRLGASGGPDAAHLVEDLVAARGIDVMTDVDIHAVERRAIQLPDGRAIPFDYAVILPPATGVPWLAGSGLDDGTGFVPTTAYLQHPDYPDIYALGDVVSQPWPKMGHAAMSQAGVAARHFVAVREHTAKPSPYCPLVVWDMAVGDGQALVVVTDRPYGGRRFFTYQGRAPLWAKRAFHWAYGKTAGALPIMP